MSSINTDFRGLDPKGLPLVSIVAVSYNHEKFLEETLDSIKAQTYTNIQLIIMDDCSQDRSVEKIEEWIEKNKVNCKFIAHKENVGICKTLNEALEYCNGEYYQGIACDDILLKDKIKNQVAEFEQSDEDVMMLFSNGMCIDEYGNTITPFPRKGQSRFKKKYVEFEDFFGEHFFGNISTGSVLIRKIIFEKIGLYDEELMAEDTDLWLRILRKYKIKYFNINAFKYRELQTSLSRVGHKSSWFYFTAYKLLEKQFDNNSISKDIIDQGYKRFIKGLYVLRNRQYWFKRIIKNKFSMFVCFHYLLASLSFSYHKGVKISKALGVFDPEQL